MSPRIDQSGELDKEELTALIEMVGMKPKDFNIDALIAEVDEDQTGTVGFHEFVHIVHNMQNTTRQKSGGLGNILQVGITKGSFGGLSNVMKNTKEKLILKLRSRSMLFTSESEKDLKIKKQQELAVIQQYVHESILCKARLFNKLTTVSI